MEQLKKCCCVGLATVLLLSISVTAQPLASNEDDASLAPLIFPKENVTVGNGPPLLIFPTENVTTGDVSIPVLKKEDTTVKPENDSDIASLIFPKKGDKVPIVDLPPLIFPEDKSTPINQTALDILNASAKERRGNVLPLPTASDENYYDSNDDSDISDSVEEVQANDKTPQKDNLEENYKLDTNALPRMPVSDYDDNTEVDHPMLKNTHLLGVIGAVLAVLCVCLYLGITVWRRVMFNRYGMRERLINEDDFYGNKSIHHNF